MMLSTRDFNTAYRNSIRFGREENTSTNDGPELENILRPGSPPHDHRSIDINTNNAVSTYVKAGDLRGPGQKKYAVY